MRILFVTATHPFPPLDGAVLPAAESIRLLAEDHEVVLAFFRGRSGEAPSGVTELRLPTATAASLANVVRRVRCIPPPGIAPFWSDRAAALLTSHPGATGADLVIVHRLHAAYVARDLPGPTLFLGQDLISAKTHQFAPAVKGLPRGLPAAVLARLYRGCERRAFGWFDRYAFVTAEEARAARALAPELDVEVIRNGVDFDPDGPRWDPATLSARRIGYFGNLDSRRNQRALAVLVGEVLPILRRNDPRYEVVVIGAGGGDLDALRAVDGVRFIGRVPDPAVELVRCSVMVNPQAEASGIKNSVLAGLACGVPTIVSPSLAECLPGGGEGVVSLASTPAEHAQRIQDLVAEEPRATAMSAAGRDLVEREFSWRRYVDALLR